VDIAPTFLELAQVPVPENMSGKSFVRQLLSKSPGRIDPQRNAVFSGFERHIGTARQGRRGYPSRAIRTDDYLYIRNFAPDRWPAGRPPTLDDIDSGSPTKTYLIAQRQEYEKHTLPDVKKEGDMSLGFLPQGNLSAVVNDPAQALTLMASKRPAEELYEVTRDPGQLNNVADNPDYAQIKEELAEQLAAEMERTGDPWSTGDGSIFDTYKYYAIDKPDKPVSTIATEK
jgi:arylsulfatase A-like enzyme